MESTQESRARDEVIDNSLDVDAKRILEAGDSFVLLSLNPEEPSSQPAGDKANIAVPQTFHGCQVLGKIGIRDATTRAELLAALEKGIAEADGVRGCFEPRHGIRAAKGDKTIDLLICFECLHMHIYRDRKTTNAKAVRITQSPLPVFQRVLLAAGIPLADAMGEEGQKN